MKRIFIALSLIYFICLLSSERSKPDSVKAAKFSRW